MAVIKLSLAEVTAIKKRIWDGETREDIAQDFDVSLGQICNIGSGYRWADVAWPDGSYGALPQKRKDLIEKARTKVHDKMSRLVKAELRD